MIEKNILKLQENIEFRELSLTERLASGSGEEKNLLGTKRANSCLNGSCFSGLVVIFNLYPNPNLFFKCNEVPIHLKINT